MSGVRTGDARQRLTTFALLREKFVWNWENVPLSQRVTNPAKGRYPDACFDGSTAAAGFADASRKRLAQTEE